MTFPVPVPVRVKVSAGFLAELCACEEGRYQDALWARAEGNTAEVLAVNDYQLVFNDFSGRFKTIIECRNIDEVAELYYVCKSGTIGVHGYKRTADRVAAEIRHLLVEHDPDLLNTWK